MIQPERKIQAVIEVVPDGDPNLRARLIAAAYHLSQKGLVILALRGVSPGAVDRLLDAVVAASRKDVEGVLYLDAAHPAAVLEPARRAAIVVATTPEFHARLAALGIPVVEPARAIEELERQFTGELV